MPRKVLKKFQVERLAILNQYGIADPKLELPLHPLQLKKMFEDMLRLREFDARAIAMQRQGRMGTYAATTGQEAIHIGTAAALAKYDWAVPCFREQGVYLSRGVRATLLFLFFMGTEEGNRIPKELRTLPYCVPCASQTLHAVGIAMAAKIKKDPLAVITYLGDGATSEGDFHEAMNFASVYQAPVIFVCQNNHWAISTPLEIQSHSTTLAQKAIAYGMNGLQVDGNDVLAIHRATQEALTRAKQGGGPTFLECLTYRMCPHTTSDDPNRYRTEAEVQAWANKDPLIRFEKYLLGKGILEEGEREALRVGIAERLKEDAAEAETLCQTLNPEEMFAHLYRHIPDILKPQLQEVLSQFHPEESEGVAHA